MDQSSSYKIQCLPLSLKQIYLGNYYRMYILLLLLQLVVDLSNAELVNDDPLSYLNKFANTVEDKTRIIDNNKIKEEVTNFFEQEKDIFHGISRRDTKKNTIKVAIADYTPIRYHNESSELVIERNLNKYVELIESAAQQEVDLIIFPEYGLATDENLSYTTNLKPYLDTNPCKMDTTDNILKKVSCSAITNKIHIVLNLIESDNGHNYFSSILFDDEGILKQIFRKHHLTNKHRESCTPGTEEITAVTTKLGNILVMSGFDLLLTSNKEIKKAEVDKVILTASIENEEPFIRGADLHKAYAQMNNLTLLVSSLNYNKYQGSGIYGQNLTLFAKNELIISNIPIDNEDREENNRNSLPKSFTFKDYEFCLHELNTPTDNCQVTIAFENDTHKTEYKKVTCLNKNKLQEVTNITLCGMVFCPDKVCETTFPDNPIIIKKIEIKMFYNGNIIQALPVSFKSDDLPVKTYEYREESNNIRISVNNDEEQVIAFGLLLIVDEDVYSGEGTTSPTIQLDSKSGGRSMFSRNLQYLFLLSLISLNDLLTE